MSEPVILVSGGSSGLGSATVNRLVKKGYAVAIIDLDPISPADLSAHCQFYQCDVTNFDAVANTIATIVEKQGQLFGAVCCAGIAPGSKILGRSGPHSFELFAKTLSVNTMGTFNVLVSSAAQMEKNLPDEKGQRGVIITTTSIAAFEGQIGQIAYSASKGAVAAMTLPAARELAKQGIRVMSIAPGVFDTPMMQGMPDEVRRSIAATIPFPAALADPEDFASMAEHILQNTTLNGEVIRLDGALRLPAN